MGASSPNSDDVFKILIASDVHLGYDEKDPIRGDDSFNTFEEILQIGQERKVDLILLGGDLFHDNKPSPQCVHKCLTLLRRYCLGDKPVSFEFLSDQAENFQHCVFPVVNYEDPNFNVSIPVFSIHGNHDDPSGYGRVATLDILCASGLINYFGKWTDLTHVQVSPILLQKGVSRLALYGLSYIRDERLSRLFRDRKVSMLRPKEFVDEWFNVFVLHQNRVMRGQNNYLQEEVLDEFLDLVIWGHEHECRIDPERNVNKGFHVIQPGSPVATSLCEGESVEKFVSVIQVHKKEFMYEKIKLKTVRPFIMDSLSLSNCTLNREGGVLNEEVQFYLTECVEDLIRKSQAKVTGHRKQPTLPLIRLRVEYSNEMEYFNPIRFGQQFSDRVANPTDLILLKRERKERKVKSEDPLDRDALGNIIENDDREAAVGEEWDSRAEMIVEKYFSEGNANNQLQVLSVRGLAEAVRRVVDKGDSSAIQDITCHQIKKIVNHIVSKKIVADEDTIANEIENYRLQRLNKLDDEIREAEIILDHETRTLSITNGRSEVCDPGDSIEEYQIGDVTIPSAGKVSRGRGRGSKTATTTSSRGRGSRGGRKSRGAPAGNKTIMEALAVQRTSSRPRKTKVEYVSDSD